MRNCSKNKLSLVVCLLPLRTVSPGYPHRLKLWPNDLASRCNGNLKNLNYLWLRLARLPVHLSLLAITCTHFGRDQICTQVKPSFHSLLSFHAPGLRQSSMRWNFPRKQSTKATIRPQACKRFCMPISRVSPTRLSTLAVRCTVLPTIPFSLKISLC